MSSLPPLDPAAYAATKLKSQPLQTPWKRKGIELDLYGKGVAAGVQDRKTAQKAHEANMKFFEPITDTVAIPYTMEGARMLAAERDRVAGLYGNYEKNGKDPKLNPDDPTTEAGRSRIAFKAAYAQYAANTKSMFDYVNKVEEDIRTNPGSYAEDALSQVMAAKQDVTVPLTGQMPDLQVRLFDWDRHAQTYLSALKEEATASAGMGPDGIRRVSDTFVLAEDAKSAIRAALQKPEARNEVLRRFRELPTDQKQSVMSFAKNNNIPFEEAMTFSTLVPVYSFNKHESSLTEKSAAGYGADREEAGAINFIEKGIGMNNPANKGKTMRELGIKNTEGADKLLAAHPSLGRFDINDHELFNGYNDMVFQKTEMDGKKQFRYVKGILRNPVTGNTRVVTMNANGGAIEVTPEIPPNRFYSDVMDKLAEYNPELDHKSVGYVYQKKYGPIKGQEGNIDLPVSGKLFNAPAAGGGLNFNAPVK